MRNKKTTKIKNCILLLIFLILFSPHLVTAETEKNHSKKTNQYISSLDYNNNDILTHQGETVENVPPTESNLKKGNFVVLTREKKQLNNSTADIAIINSNSNRIYPGALLKADSGLLNNNPSILSVKRNPLTLSVDLPGITNNDSYLTVDAPTNSSVRSATNQLLDKWNKNYSTSYPNIPAKIQYSTSTAYSMDQLKAKFGLAFDKIAVPLNIDFSSVTSGEKQVQIINFKQIYYTISMDDPETAGDVFDKSVTVKQLKNRGINNETPPVYVSNVAYGRSMYIKLETSNNSTEVQNAFNALIKGADLSQNTEYTNILKDTSFTAFMLGGSADTVSKIVSGNISDLKSIIQEGCLYNQANPGVPISYTTSFLKDGSLATVQNQTDYIETKSTTYNQGAISLDHSGAYVNRYFIYWDELSHDETGNQILTPREWDKNGWNLTAHFNTTIPLKGNATNIRVKVEECTGLAWEWWRTIYDKSDLPLVPHRTISNWGTTLYPKVSDDVS